MFRIPQIQLIKAKWRQLSVMQRGTIAISIPLACLIASFGTHLWFRSKAIVSAQWVDRTQQVLLASNSLLSDMLDAETSVRGYSLSHQPSFLAPYQQALTALPQNFEQLKQLIQDNPVQVERVQKLERLANQQLIVYQKIVRQVERASQAKQPIALIDLQLIETKASMDRFRTILEQLRSEEQRLLVLRQKHLQEQRDLNILAICLGLLLSSLGALLAIRLFMDLSQELRKGELLLRESSNLIRAVFAHTIDGVVVLDAQMRVEDINRSAAQMFGYSLSELAGQDWQVLLDRMTGIDDSINLVGGQTAGPQYWQAMGQRQDGTSFPVEGSIGPIDLDDRYVVIVRDVTERHQTTAALQDRADKLATLNAALNATNAALSASNRDLDQFAYVVAHDLKAPLRAIANLSTWIEEDLADKLPPESQKYMQLLRGRVNRLEALLNGLLEYARIDQLEVPIETVDVAELLNGTIQTIAPPSTFEIEIDPHLPTLPTRRLLLQKVLSNLIENAIEYHPTKVGKVSVSVRDNGDRYEFAIADDGAGIDPRFHSKIYSIFQTLQPRDTHESTGVGLAIVKKIVEMEGGEIQLDSAVGRGATFRFTWPKMPINLQKDIPAFMSIGRSA